MMQGMLAILFFPELLVSFLPSLFNVFFYRLRCKGYQPVVSVFDDVVRRYTCTHNELEFGTSLPQQGSLEGGQFSPGPVYAMSPNRQHFRLKIYYHLAV
jgi:hypothetical protein